MTNLFNELAAIDLEISAIRQPIDAGQTPEFWKLVESRVKLQNRVEREDREERESKLL